MLVAPDYDALFVDAKTRVVQNFLFNPAERQAVETAILQANLDKRSIWTRKRVNPDWIAEIPIGCAEFLFGERKSSDEESSHFEISNDALNYFFPQLVVELRRKSNVLCACSVENKPGWEISLGSTGVGFVVFSFSVEKQSLNVVRQAAYLFSQTRSFKVVEVVPYKRNAHTLNEWTDLLVPISHIAAWRRVPLNTTFTVARFTAAIDFTEPHFVQLLGPDLQSLAQAEEEGHPRSLATPTQIPARILNSKHWAACSYIGSAHFVVDQYPNSSEPDQQTFDQQRFYNAATRYFLAFLAAFAQRLTLERLNQDSFKVLAEIGKTETAKEYLHHRDSHSAVAASTGLNENLRKVRDEAMAFAIQGHLFDFSYRDSVNRYYDIAQTAQRVKPTLELVRLAIRDLDGAYHARLQTSSLHGIVATQHDVELIEIFLITVYAIEFGRTIGELAGFAEGYMSWSVLALALIGAGLAIFLLRPFKKLHFWRGFWLAATPFLLFIIGGIVSMSPRGETQSVPETVQARHNFAKLCGSDCLAAHPYAAQLVSDAYRREEAHDWESAASFWVAATRRVELDNAAQQPPKPQLPFQTPPLGKIQPEPVPKQRATAHASKAKPGRQ